MKKNLFRSITVVVILIIVSGSVFPVFGQNDPESGDSNLTEFLFTATKEGKSLVDVLIVDQELTGRKRGIILHYCDSILRTKKIGDPDGKDKDLERYGFDIDTYKYDPRQSLFVYAMCVNIDEESKGRTIAGTKHIYRNYKKIFENVKYDESAEPIELDVTKFWKEDMELNDIWGIPRQSSLDSKTTYSSCDPTKVMQSCDFSSILPVIFKNIMNEYSNIKLASIYGYTKDRSSDKKILDTAVKDFSDNYFKDPVDENSPCDYKEMPYLNSETTSGKQKHCSHPETTKELRETIKSAQRLIEKLKFLDHEKIMDPFEDKEKSLNIAKYCKDKKKGTSAKHILHACSFNNRGDVSFNSDWQSFYNLAANELMWYNLFIDYYVNKIISNTAYGPLRFGSISFTYLRNQKEAKNFSYEKGIAQEAMSQTLRMLTNVYTTFPSYIALKAYQEDLLNYRETLAKTYTPLHQLYYTFRNVQACQDGQ